MRLLRHFLLSMAIATMISGPAPAKRKGGPAAAAAPLIVLVHGWAGDRRVWLSTRQRIHGQSVAIDLPGHGADRHSVAGWPIERFSEALESARRNAHAHCVVLVTHSNGSYVALDYWKRHSAMVGAMVIVEGTFTRPFSDPASFQKQIDKVTDNWAAYTRRPFGLERAKPTTVTLVKKIAASASPPTAKATLEMLLSDPLWAPTQIRVPVTFAFTESPSWTPAEIARLQATAPNSNVARLGQLSHYAQLDSPAMIAKLVDDAVGRAQCNPG